MQVGERDKKRKKSSPKKGSDKKEGTFEMVKVDTNH